MFEHFRPLYRQATTARSNSPLVMRLLQLVPLARAAGGQFDDLSRSVGPGCLHVTHYIMIVICDLLLFVITASNSSL